ncbi:hypothetical protein AB0C59_21545 [Streptomyces sp. NPDC048664]|uniref:hypothetical protein n=1 Tax=Streptomyces sp. NPDC048664 TaxID=3154505 RepID=UPI003433D368
MAPFLLVAAVTGLLYTFTPHWTRSSTARNSTSPMPGAASCPCPSRSPPHGRSIPRARWSSYARAAATPRHRWTAPCQARNTARTSTDWPARTSRPGRPPTRWPVSGSPTTSPPP